MAKKKSLTDRIFAIVLVIIFGGSIIIGFVTPYLSKKDDKQDDIQKAIDSLNDKSNSDSSDSSQENTPKVDPSLKQAGDITQMQIIDEVTGGGAEAKLGQKIKVNYTGALAKDGTVFDSRQDTEFTLAEGQLISGWIEGIPGMKVGGKRKLVIPSDKGYGPKGSGSQIPPDSDLVFEIELLSVN